MLLLIMLGETLIAAAATVIFLFILIRIFVVYLTFTMIMGKICQ